MKEQSHKSEMRAALKGDFERLRARRDDSAPPGALAPSVADPEPAPEAAQAVAPVATEPIATDPQPARSSWLDRLRERR